MLEQPRALQPASADRSLEESPLRQRPHTRNRPVETIDEVILDLRGRMEQLSELIDERLEESANTNELVKLFALHAQTASRLGRLLRDRQILSGDATDALIELMERMRKELKGEKGWRL